MRCVPLFLQTQTVLPCHQNFARLLPTLLVSLTPALLAGKILQALVWLLADHFTCPMISSVSTIIAQYPLFTTPDNLF